MLFNVNYANNRHFNLAFSNIIILVLANMAIFGSLSYLFTIRNRWARIGILPFIMAVFLGNSTEGAWVQEIMSFSPVPWFYKFYYLKYLFIVIPGSIAGEYLKDWLNNKTDDKRSNKEIKNTPYIILITIGLVIFNLYGLYMRYLVANLICTIILLSILYWLLKFEGNNAKYWRRLFIAGCYLLMLGLFFESYEGGIRKDSSTYSYYFVTSGLAFISMITFSIICDIYRWKIIAKPLEMAGQNPMIAYVAPQLFVIPIINLLGLNVYLDLLNQTAWMGFLRGVIVTFISVAIAILFTRIKWFWRT